MSSLWSILQRMRCFIQCISCYSEKCWYPLLIRRRTHCFRGFKWSKPKAEVSISSSQSSGARNILCHFCSFFDHVDIMRLWWLTQSKSPFKHVLISWFFMWHIRMIMSMIHSLDVVSTHIIVVMMRLHMPEQDMSHGMQVPTYSRIQIVLRYSTKRL